MVNDFVEVTVGIKYFCGSADHAISRRGFLGTVAAALGETPTALEALTF